MCVFLALNGSLQGEAVVASWNDMLGQIFTLFQSFVRKIFVILTIEQFYLKNLKNIQSEVAETFFGIESSLQEFV